MSSEIELKRAFYDLQRADNKFIRLLFSAGLGIFTGTYVAVSLFVGTRVEYLLIVILTVLWILTLFNGWRQHKVLMVSIAVLKYIDEYNEIKEMPGPDELMRRFNLEKKEDDLGGNEK